jgi:4-hydroxy-3-methylbut-2-enyl diphosphate reductase
MLANRGIDPYKYDTTCPFVEKVWNRAEALGKKSYTIIVHGKYNHEETIATFSHSKQNSPTLIIRNIEETKLLCDIILGKIPASEFYTFFEGKYSEGFDVVRDLDHIGVVNQTTMLATETQAIADMIKRAMAEKYGEDKIKDHYADTSDTLCYATYDNQQATLGLLDGNADFAIVVGGYNSSNTSHIVELCESKLPVYFISGAEKIISEMMISHYNIHKNQEETTTDWLRNVSGKPTEIILTSGASCPDAILDEVLQKIVSYYPGASSIDEALLPFKVESLN